MRATHILSMAACLGLFGCSGDGDGDAPGTKPDDTGPVQTTDDTGPVTTEDTGMPTTNPYVDNVPPEGPASVTGLLAGNFYPLAAFDGTPVLGGAQLVRYVDGTARVSVAAAGLASGTPHNVHVHTWPCDYEAGGHYKIDPAVKETVDTNELWPAFTTDADGRGMAYVSTGPIRGEALSVIIHDPVSGDKMACADLEPLASIGGKASGTFSPFALYETIDETITGTAEITYLSSSKLNVSVQGLDDGEEYRTHLHALPCDTLDAGGHYKLDPSNLDTVEANEVWPTLTPSGGSANDEVTTSGHMIRDDAQAVVLHRVVGNEVPKVACATLTRAAWNERFLSGSPSLLPEATARGLDIQGSATLTRRLDGVSVAEVELYYLAPNAVHPIHLHDAPCSVGDGGGHYYVDPGQSEVGESNELWVTVQSNENGYAKRAVGIPHVVRAEAQSMVVHAEDGARLACIDLN